MLNYLRHYHKEDFRDIDALLNSWKEFYWKAKQASWEFDEAKLSESQGVATSTDVVASQTIATIQDIDTSQGIARYDFAEGDMRFERRRYGAFGLSEQELLYHKGQVVWTMHAHGCVQWFPDTVRANEQYAAFAGQTRAFLTTALKSNADGSLRKGGGSFRGHDFVKNHWWSPCGAHPRRHERSGS